MLTAHAGARPRAGWAIPVLCLLFAGCASMPAATPDRRAVIQGIVAVTVKVTLEREGRRVGSGSGVVVASRMEASASEAATYVLTAQHLLDGKDGAAIFVRFMGLHAAAGKIPARLFRAGNAGTLDLAVLRLAGVAAAPAVLARDEPEFGEEILIAGFPWGKRFGLFGGIVSQLPAAGGATAPTDDGGTEATLVVDAASANGVSGGGVFLEATGELLGVVEGYQTASIAVEGRSRSYSLKVPVAGETFAVPAARIREFLEAAGLSDVELGAAEGDDGAGR
jgi:hypothetical protein